MKENVIKLYKKWAKPYVKYYGDFDSAEDLVFTEGKNCTINVTHPEGAEDYGEGEDGGVNGFIVPMYEFFKGEFKIEIPFDLDNWEDYYNIELEELVGLATRYGLVLDTMHDIKIIRPRVKGQQFMEFCSKEQLEKYVKFFDELSDGKLAFEENMSYFTWSISGHDDYYKFEKIDGVWYIFWITRYDPNF